MLGSRHARWSQVARCALGSLAAWCKYSTIDAKKVAARSYSPGCYFLLYSSAERNCADQTCAFTLARLFPRTIQNTPPPMLNRIITASKTWGAPKGNRGNHEGGCCED